ncbi:LysR family transcriptional regulator [Paludibaculum fermentans]|uniref:LysR family transcriptional regulator n=1 Tax=Paludibaculum fermentans TaxID=1473598 RepID=A0A7S7NWV2_PALFE|nr:LysR family transcriptional regulator [Paludibaculum fermentans]QOY91230.1 LysR family transcriptional regulator [Paludibaculum fermentans]
MTNLNLRHFEAFAAIAAAGNFTRAAQALHVSQPALTVQIRQLEETIGVRLLDRNTRSVKLTRIGQQLSPVIQRLLREIDSVILNARELATGDRGSVSVTGLPSVCSTILPRIIAEFRQQQPGITVSLRDAVAQVVLAQVKNEEVDFGIGSFADAEPAIQVVPLFNDQMRVVFPPGSPLGKRRSIQLKQLITEPMILMSQQSSVRILVDRAFQSMGHFPVPAYEATYMSTAIGMVKAGLGITFLPTSAFEASELGGLGSRILKEPGLTRRIVAIQKSGRTLSPAATAFLRALIAGCKALRPAPRIRHVDSE